MAKRGKRRVGGMKGGKGAVDTPFQHEVATQGRGGKRGRKGRGKSRR